MNAPIQAFVLKCPECGAPQPGTTSVCTHCKVPLMWAPTRRFGSDDHGLYDVEDEPGTELMSFGPYTIAGGATTTFSLQPQKMVRPRFLWIHPRCSDSVYVSNIRLGTIIVADAGGSNSSFSGSLFSRGRGFPLDTEAMMQGILFTFQISNAGAHALSVEGVLRVMPFKDGPIRNPHLRERFPGEWGPVIVGGDSFKKREPR